MAFDPSLFTARRRGLEQQFGAQTAMNAYSKFLSQTRGQREQQEYSRGVEKELPRLTSRYGRRGVYGQGVRSGIYRRGLEDFGTEAARQRGYMSEDLSNALRQYDLQQASSLSGYEQQLTDLEAEKARQIAEDAAVLMELR